MDLFIKDLLIYTPGKSEIPKRSYFQRGSPSFPLFPLYSLYMLTAAIMRQVLAGFDRGAERTADFTFGHTGHMDIILGRGGGRGQDTGRGTGGILENIKEKAKNVTKRNFL